jgi:hypothetical protein
LVTSSLSSALRAGRFSASLRCGMIESASGGPEPAAGPWLGSSGASRYGEMACVPQKVLLPYPLRHSLASSLDSTAHARRERSHQARHEPCEALYRPQKHKSRAVSTVLTVRRGMTRQVSNFSLGTRGTGSLIETALSSSGARGVLYSSDHSHSRCSAEIRRSECSSPLVVERLSTYGEICGHSHWNALNAA